MPLMPFDRGKYAFHQAKNTVFDTKKNPLSYNICLLPCKIGPRVCQVGLFSRTIGRCVCKNMPFGIRNRPLGVENRPFGMPNRPSGTSRMRLEEISMLVTRESSRILTHDLLMLDFVLFDGKRERETCRCHGSTVYPFIFVSGSLLIFVSRSLIKRSSMPWIDILDTISEAERLDGDNELAHA